MLLSKYQDGGKFSIEKLNIGQRFILNEVKKIELYNDIGQVYSETVINRLISGKIDDYTFYSEDIGNLYDDFMENLYLVVVDMSHCEAKHINLAYFRDLFNRLGTINRYAIYADYIIIIISTDSAPLNGNNEFNENSRLNEFIEINKVFEQNNIYAGISSCFDDIYELQKHYIEAVDALNSGIKNKEQQSNGFSNMIKPLSVKRTQNYK